MTRQQLKVSWKNSVKERDVLVGMALVNMHLLDSHFAHAEN